MTEIYFVRHPESLLNTDPSLVSGRSNHVPVTERGIHQAKLFARAFARNYPTPDALFSSPAVRTQTLMDIYKDETGVQHPVLLDDRLQEMTQGLADGTPREAVYTDEVVTRIQQELFDFKLPEGESLNEVSDRMLDWIQEAHLNYPNKTLLVASHGQAIRAAIGSLLGWNHYDVTRNPDTATPNTALACLGIDEGGTTVRFMNRVIIDEATASEK